MESTRIDQTNYDAILDLIWVNQGLCWSRTFKKTYKNFTEKKNAVYLWVTLVNLSKFLNAILDFFFLIRNYDDIGKVPRHHVFPHKKKTIKNYEMYALDEFFEGLWRIMNFQFLYNPITSLRLFFLSTLTFVSFNKTKLYTFVFIRHPTIKDATFMIDIKHFDKTFRCFSN